MKNLITKEEKDQIDLTCVQYSIMNYTINPDGSIDVNGDVRIVGKHPTLSLKFGKVSGNFSCSCNQLTSLNGAPHSVGGDFNCFNNQLTSLEGSPTYVGGYLLCDYNRLTSTYSSDTDVEVAADVDLSGNLLPTIFMDNYKHIKLILKYQRHFVIWNDDLTLNEENFRELLDEIKDGLL